MAAIPPLTVADFERIFTASCEEVASIFFNATFHNGKRSI
jgi:hypothetical protein